MAANEWEKLFDPRFNNVWTNTSIFRGLKRESASSSCRGLGKSFNTFITSSGLHFALMDTTNLCAVVVPGNDPEKNNNTLVYFYILGIFYVVVCSIWHLVNFYWVQSSCQHLISLLWHISASLTSLLVIFMNKQGSDKWSPVLLGCYDALGLSTFVVVSPDHGTHSDDTGQPIMGDNLLPFLPQYIK